MFKDPLVRRFISASFFAAAFVWVAVTYFNVETEVVWVLFLFSFIFVGGMMVVGLVLAPIVRFFQRDSSPFLSSLEAPASSELVDEAAKKETIRSPASE
ncbi:MAG: hypothetical protein JJ934_14380 [Pseudomonadales bacterium]|nr:hypothetical protein [Pseudomonadales bacterium]MBO6702040.1 hypothetical protein [Pseudomonadales bacterium]MBO7007083.1 hypothetical protein [Pseudomonadales bacterium]